MQSFPSVAMTADIDDTGDTGDIDDTAATGSSNR